LRASVRAGRSFRRPFAWGLVLSAGLHLSFYPLLSLLSIPGLPRHGLQEFALATLELPPLVPIPSPPDQVKRPELPLPRSLALDEDLRIVASGMRSPADAGLGPPPAVQAETADIDFVRYDVPPLLGNRGEFGQMVWHFYPLELQRAGVEGSVELAMFVDVHGQVGDVRVEESSGFPRMDDAARQLAYRMEFLPALMRDQLVGVWVHQRICFLLPRRAAATSPAGAARRRIAVAKCGVAAGRR
jgi:protein TonB